MNENKENTQQEPLNTAVQDGIPKGMKKCKTCGKVIAKSAKRCPTCGAKQKGKAGLIIGIVVLLIIIAGVAGSGGKSKKEESASPSSSAQTTSETNKTEAEEPVEYADVAMVDLTRDLDANAMNAEEKYTDKYFRVTGVLNNIDSDGKYISIGNGVEDVMSDDYSFTSMQCYMKDDAAKDKVKQMTKGDTVTVCGKITSVGEVLGYSMDIDYIE